MIALYHRAKTGEGQIVDGSLLATSITYMQAFLAERSVTGIAREQRGNTGFYSSPADVYRTTDGWIMLQTVGGDMFGRWARLVGREELIGDPRFATDISRADHREIVTQATNQWLAGKTTADALSALEAARVPAGPVLDLPEVLADPQVNARGLLEFVDYPGAPKPVPLAATAVQLSATPARIRHRAPTLGEHTAEVLGELGYSEEEIRQLRAAQAV
jgi:crotonobetainyl-CoA:carnitine CoA-transferase CaiB-like acyl-CoA transferase